MRYTLVVFIFVSILSCQTNKTEQEPKEDYQGPIYEFDSVDSFISDSAVVRGRLKAAKRLYFNNRDQHFPKGLYLEFFNKEGEMTSTFIADDVFYTAKKAQYKSMGNVRIKSLTSGDELTTELLYWDQRTGLFHTDQFVTIKSDDEIHTGEGMESNSDFTRYRILKPQGTISIDPSEGL